MSNNTMTIELPNNPEAEQALLGSLLIDPAAYYDVSDFLRAEHFYQARHRWVYEAMIALAGENQPIDVIALADKLTIDRDMEYNEAIASLTGYSLTVPTSINAAQYGRIVHSAAIRRSLIAQAGRIATLAHDGSLSIGEMLEQAERAVFACSEGYGMRDIIPIRDGMLDLYDATLERREAGGGMIGVPTGFIDLDRLLNGLQRDKLVTLAGRPGMGKSALSNGIAINIAKQNKVVAIFNLEMSTEEILQRQTALESGLALTSIQCGELDDHQLRTFGEATGRLSNLPIFIDDTPGLRPSQLRAKCRRIYAEHGLDLVIVDYLGLMDGDGSYGNQTALVSYISRELKKLAKELHITVLALSQLNRSVESRADKRPLLADLRDSGSVEQDSDVVLFIYRDEYYNPDTTDRANIAEVHCAKNRNGPTGTVDLYWHGQLTAFRNLERREINF